MDYKLIKPKNILQKPYHDYAVTCIANSTCPACGIGTNDNVVDCFYSSQDNLSAVLLYTVRRCSICGELTFNRYHLQKHLLTRNPPYHLDYCTDQFPRPNDSVSFSEEIRDISSDFVKIYSEALQAENSGLGEICGMGYRKALEFLVKDFLIHKNPDYAEQITKEKLMDSVRRIEDNKVKILVERSLWLANDECHYNRKQENYDLDDLKSFIFAIVTAIEYDITFTKALGVPRK